MDAIIATLDTLPATLPAVEDGTGTWTRGELRRAVLCAGSYLEIKGIGPDDRVAVITEPGDKRLVAAMLGARAAGAVVCPVAAADAADTLTNLGARMVISSAPGHIAGAVNVGEILTGPEVGSRVGANDRFSGKNAWGVATAGSSGLRKTVLMAQKSVAHVTHAVQDIVRYGPGDRIHAGLPLHHSYGLSQLWLSIVSGACLVIPTGYPTRGNLAAWIAGVTVLPTISSKLRMLYQLGFCPGQRLITLAGQDVDRRTREHFSKYATHTRHVLFYGLTEATTRVLWLDNDEFFDKPEATGRPIRGVRVWLDEEGELWVDGPNVAAGYLGNPEESNERFPNGVLRTGDHFEFDGDLYYFRGRMDGIFKRFGEKVIPEIVEKALLSHAGILQCLVTPDPDATPGTEPAPVAWLVANPDGPDKLEIIRYARKRLPAAMVPIKVHFVSALATTDGGKLIRKVPR